MKFVNGLFHGLTDENGYMDSGTDGFVVATSQSPTSQMIEVVPRTYAPDFNPVEYTWKDNILKSIQKTEPENGIQKEISIQDNAVHLRHRMINRNVWRVELAPWCLSVMAAGV